MRQAYRWLPRAGVNRAWICESHVSLSTVRSRYREPNRWRPGPQTTIPPSPCGGYLGIGRMCYRGFPPESAAPPIFRQELMHHSFIVIPRTDAIALLTAFSDAPLVLPLTRRFPSRCACPRRSASQDEPSPNDALGSPFFGPYPLAYCNRFLC